jgi:exonuclease V gamma subunit
VIDGVHVRGEVQVGDEHVVHQRISGPAKKHLLRAWIHHVLASVMRHRDGDGWPAVTVWVARDRDRCLRALDAAETDRFAAVLVDGYRAGLAEPLPMLMDASAAYGEALRDGADAGARRREAARAYEGKEQDWGRTGDRHDPDVALCWRGRDPLADPRFAAWAERLWQPIHERVHEP